MTAQLLLTAVIVATCYWFFAMTGDVTLNVMQSQIETATDLQDVFLTTLDTLEDN